MDAYIKADMHIHTIASGHAFCTVNECIKVAQEAGLALISITDHGPSMEGSAHEGHFEMCARLPKYFGTLEVLFGCELNILNKGGDVDLTASVMEDLDVVLAGIHRRTPYDFRTDVNNTKAIINSIKRHSSINIITHPYRTEYPVSVSDIVDAAIEFNVLLEVNASLILGAVMNHSRGMSVNVVDKTAEMVQLLQSKGVGYLVNSDAHHTSEIGILNHSFELLISELGLLPEYVLNCRPEALKKIISFDRGAK
jgi:putative hydrolase